MTGEPVDGDQLDAIRGRAAAATPGPWYWRGNVDHRDPFLGAYLPGRGLTPVLSAVRVERTKDDRCIANVYDVAPDDARWVIENYLHDLEGETRDDEHLAFLANGQLVDARQLAVFEVAPTATSRDDPAVYRADVMDLRHPDALFIKTVRTDVDWLIAEVDRLRSRTVLGVLTDAVRRALHRHPRPRPDVG